MIINIPSVHGREGLDATAIVIHAAAEYIRFNDRDIHIIDYLRSRGQSAHAYVLPSGDIVRTRRNDQIAWHCRAQGYNFKSIGIEFLVPGAWTYDDFLKVIDTDWLLERQYEGGLKFIKELMEPGKINEIERHCIIDPNRKKDPGEGFPWLLLNKDIREAGYEFS